MSKPIWTAEKIQQHLQSEVNAIKAVQEDGANINIPLPSFHTSDKYDVNWEIGAIENVSHYLPEIIKIIDALKFEVNLKT